MAEKLRLPDNMAALPNVSALLALVEMLETREDGLPGMGVFYGRPGLGKTSGGVICEIAMNVIHVVVPAFVSEKGLLVMLARELGLQPKRVMQDLFDQVASAIEEANRTLILDEADYLMGRARVVNMVRLLHDRTGVPVVLMGEEDLPQQLLQWERVHGRVLEFVGAAEATPADVDMLARIYAKGVELAPDLREAVLKSSAHSHRYIAINLTRIRLFATARGLSRLAKADWGDQAFKTEVSPVPRSIPLHKQKPARKPRAA